MISTGMCVPKFYDKDMRRACKIQCPSPVALQTRIDIKSALVSGGCEPADLIAGPGLSSIPAMNSR